MLYNSAKACGYLSLRLYKEHSLTFDTDLNFVAGRNKSEAGWGWTTAFFTRYLIIMVLSMIQLDCGHHSG